MRILIGCLLACSLLIMTGCLKHELATGMTEAEAQELIVLLKEHGLDATRQAVVKEREAPTWTVSVKGGDQNQILAWRVMKENGYPRQRVKGLEEVFANPGLIPTAGEEKARLLVGLSGEISRTLKSVDSVVDARVHVVLPDNSPLLDRSQIRPPSASVLLKYQGNQPPLKEDEIKNLVAKGVEGLAPENIAVVFKRVYPKAAPSYDFFWYLGNQQVTVISVVLLVISAICLMVLMGRVRLQKAKIERLEQKFEAAVPGKELAGAGVNKR